VVYLGFSRPECYRLGQFPIIEHDSLSLLLFIIRRDYTESGYIFLAYSNATTAALFVFCYLVLCEVRFANRSGLPLFK
jgi:hypothetical protein